MKSALPFMLVAVLIASAARTQAQDLALRPTMTVVEFETDRTGWVPPPELGATLADLLADGLVGSGQYRVLDREFLGVRSERSHRTSITALRDAAAHANVDYVVLGSVTRFSTEQRRRTGGGIIPHIIGLPFLGGVGTNRTESVIALTIRVIDVHSGEIAATATAQGRASRASISLGALSVLHHGVGAGGYSSSTSGIRDGLVDEALKQAVADAGKQLVLAAPRLQIQEERFLASTDAR